MRILKLNFNGVTRVRILPGRTFYQRDEERHIPWAVPNYTHWDSEVSRIFACTGERCPRCARYRSDPNRYRGSKKITRTLFNVINRDDPDKEVFVLNICMTVTTIIAEFGDDDCYDPLLGRDLHIVHRIDPTVRRGNHNFPSYNETRFANDPSPLADSEEEIVRICRRTHDIRNLVAPGTSSPIPPRRAPEPFTQAPNFERFYGAGRPRTQFRLPDITLDEEVRNTERAGWDLWSSRKKYRGPKSFDFNAMKKVYRHGL